MAYKQQLKQGKIVEREHLPFFRQIKKETQKTGKCPTENEFVEGIAKAHISEDKNYYTKLNKAKL